jgi:hypothetical protein
MPETAEQHDEISDWSPFAFAIRPDRKQAFPRALSA